MRVVISLLTLASLYSWGAYFLKEEGRIIEAVAYLVCFHISIVATLIVVYWERRK